MTIKTCLKIGEVSEQTGIAIGTLRYYERLSLLTAERCINGHRYYSHEAIKNGYFIKKVKYFFH